MTDMCVRSEERIVLRFTRKELSALLSLLALGALPGTDIAPQTPDEETLQSLQEGEWIVRGDGCCMVDRIAAMVLTNMACGSVTQTGQSEFGREILYGCRQMSALLTDNGGKWIRIEPIEKVVSGQ